MLDYGEIKMIDTHLLQDAFLERLKQEQKQVADYLTNGIKLQGRVVDYSQYVIILGDKVQQLVYKHAISTVMPVVREQDYY